MAGLRIPLATRDCKQSNKARNYGKQHERIAMLHARSNLTIRDWVRTNKAHLESAERNAETLILWIGLALDFLQLACIHLFRG
jgi:hypothetical protein